MADEPRWLTDEEGRIWRNFSWMQLQLRAVLVRGLADDGLSDQDFLVLADLSDRPDSQARLHEICHRLGWEKSRLSHHVKRMEQRGLVAKVPCPSDRRGSFVTMTSAGRAAIERAAPGHVELVRRHFIDLLSPEQLLALDEIAVTVLAEIPDD